MKNLYFMRHGLTFDNIEGRFSGHSDSELSPEGHRQAEEAGDQAKQQGLYWDTIVCSPLQRTRHTAGHVAKAVGHSEQDVLTSDLFIERNFGPYEGKQQAEFLYPNTSFVYRNLDYMPDVESYADMYIRATQAWEYLKSLDAESILVVSHGGIGRAFESVILKRSLEEAYLKDKRGRFPNAQIVKLI